MKKMGNLALQVLTDQLNQHIYSVLPIKIVYQELSKQSKSLPVLLLVVHFQMKEPIKHPFYSIYTNSLIHKSQGKRQHN